MVMKSKINWWVWERPATIHLMYTVALGAEYALKKTHGHAYAPHLYGFFRNNMVRWMCDFDALISNGRKVVPHFLDSATYQQKQKLWNALTQQLLQQFQKLDTTDLRKITDIELLKAYTEFDELYLRWWGYGQVAELVSYGGEDLLKDKLTPHQIKNYFGILATPTQKSYAHTEEEAILNIVKIAQEQGIDHAEVKSCIKKHAEAYYWMHNNYYDTICLDEAHFTSVVEKYLTEKPDITALQESNTKRLTEIKKQKKQIITELHLDTTTEKLIWLLDEFCSFQDYRKALNMQADAYLDNLCKEVCRRKKIKYAILRSAIPQQIRRILLGTESLKEIIDEVKQQGEHCVMIMHEDSPECEIYFSSEAAAKEREILGEEVHFKEVVELEGQCACVGRVTGTVRRLLNPRDVSEMQKGEILVTTMTTPDFVPALKKAAAIITDEGGITCHAAIVSRELGVPCIIATKNATKVLNTGDIVEVKANHGLVHIIERKKD